MHIAIIYRAIFINVTLWILQFIVVCVTPSPAVIMIDCCVWWIKRCNDEERSTSKGKEYCLAQNFNYFLPNDKLNHKRCSNGVVGADELLLSGVKLPKELAWFRWWQQMVVRRPCCRWGTRPEKMNIGTYAVYRLWAIPMVLVQDPLTIKLSIWSQAAHRSWAFLARSIDDLPVDFLMDSLCHVDSPMYKREKWWCIKGKKQRRLIHQPIQLKGNADHDPQ